MRDVFRVAECLSGREIVAIVADVNRQVAPTLRLNRALLSGDDFDRVLSWARHEIARGVRVSWLLADELADLA